MYDAVDVIIPCYGYGRFLRACVESVLSQGIEDLRVLIIDDASPDDTVAVAMQLVKEDARVSLIRHSVNMGHIATYNEGIRWASAKYMMILSADDYLTPHALRHACDLLNEYPTVGFLFGNAIELDQIGRQMRIVNPVRPRRRADRCVLSSAEFINLCGMGNPVTTCTALVRTDLQKQLGGYREELPHAGDLEMWLRFAAHAPVGFIAADQGVYRRHATNMSNAYYGEGYLSDFRQRKAAFESFLDACGGVIPNREVVRNNLFSQLSRASVRHASMAFNEGQLETSKQLAAFALSVYPRVRTSLAWVKFACKKRVGLRTWKMLQPAVAILSWR